MLFGTMNSVEGPGQGGSSSRCQFERLHLHATSWRSGSPEVPDFKIFLLFLSWVIWLLKTTRLSDLERYLNGISWWYLLRKKCVSLATLQSCFLTYCHSNGPQFQDVVTNSDPRTTSLPSCTLVVHVPCQLLSTHLLLVQVPMGQGSCAII